MSDGFEIKYDFVEKWGRLAKPEHFRIYIYILMRFKKDGVCLSKKELAERLRIDIADAEEGLEFWAAAGELSYENDTYFFTETKKATARASRSQRAHLRMRPSYTASEIDAAASVNKQIDYMFKQAEKTLGRLLSTNDLELLYSFVDWLGLPVEVVIMLLNYAAKLGKTDKRYLETLAIDWAEKDINTYEAAESFIKEMEEIHSNEHQIRSLLGIYDRALSQTEKKYIKLWTEKKISPELVSEAYERTVNATGKLSFAYMNKILISWSDAGVTTKEQIKEHEELFKIKNAPIKKKTTKKSKFNNYTDTNKHDYSKIAEKLLEDLLDE